jgi:hypothetical protein
MAAAVDLGGVRKRVNSRASVKPADFSPFLRRDNSSIAVRLRARRCATHARLTRRLAPA